MVQVKAAAVALILVAPSLAIPLQNTNAHLVELHTREPIPDPMYRVGAMIKGVKQYAPNVRKAASVAGWFIRKDETSGLSTRELRGILNAFQDVSERDLDDMEDLAARAVLATNTFRQLINLVPKSRRPRFDKPKFFGAFRPREEAEIDNLLERDYDLLDYCCLHQR